MLLLFASLHQMIGADRELLWFHATNSMDSDSSQDLKTKHMAEKASGNVMLVEISKERDFNNLSNYKERKKNERRNKDHRTECLLKIGDLAQGVNPSCLRGRGKLPAGKISSTIGKTLLLGAELFLNSELRLKGTGQ